MHTSPSLTRRIREGKHALQVREGKETCPAGLGRGNIHWFG